jgi:hypothetical protein
LTLTRQFVRVDTGGPDDEGCLLFDEHGTLVAVLVKLSGQHHGDIVGKWFLEYGFGILDKHDHPIFDTLDDAEKWVMSGACAP